MVELVEKITERQDSLVFDEQAFKARMGRNWSDALEHAMEKDMGRMGRPNEMDEQV